MVEAAPEKSPRVQEIQNYLNQFSSFPTNGLDTLLTFVDRKKDNLDQMRKSLGYLASNKDKGVIAFARMVASSGEDQAVLKALPDTASKEAMTFLLAHPKESEALLNATQGTQINGIFTITFLTKHRQDIQDFITFATEHKAQLQTFSEVLGASKDGKISLADVALHPELLQLNNKKILAFAQTYESELRDIALLAKNTATLGVLTEGLPGVVTKFNTAIAQKNFEAGQKTFYELTYDRLPQQPPSESHTLQEAETAYKERLKNRVTAQVTDMEIVDNLRSENLKKNPSLIAEWQKSSLERAEEMKKYMLELGCTNPAERNWMAAMEREAIQMAENPGKNAAQQKQNWWDKVKKHAIEQPDNAVERLPFPVTFTTFSSEALATLKPVIQNDLPAKQPASNCKSHP